jgi:hypothetical protein
MYYFPYLFLVPFFTFMYKNSAKGSTKYLKCVTVPWPNLIGKYYYKTLTVSELIVKYNRLYILTYDTK